ncbi:MAG TPA: nitrogenase stabilizing/protective protein NifW [Polyangiaceae bacterium]|nr:nitrogenase stabilizing/protective protein NifW [Polyangiaceae bacterium]
MTVLDDLRKLSAAEEFFEYLAVGYEPQVLRVARLHILRRMGEYLRSESIAELEDAVVRARCRQHLETAYGDFVRSTPLEQRVFKVLKDAVAPKKKGAFVPLSALETPTTGASNGPVPAATSGRATNQDGAPKRAP